MHYLRICCVAFLASKKLCLAVITSTSVSSVLTIKRESTAIVLIYFQKSKHKYPYIKRRAKVFYITFFDKVVAQKRMVIN